MSDASRQPGSSQPTVTTVSVQTSASAYSCVVGEGVLATLGARVREAVSGAAKALVVVDAGLPDETREAARRSLESAGLVAHITTLTPTEENKSLQELQNVLRECARVRLERSDVIIALGGGITSDLGGFAAASYRRGLAWVCCPTTLLSMVDASTGGKTGVNLRVGSTLKKNMVGAFWQPSLVLADVSTLRSLDERTLRCGLAECIKHGLLSAPFGDPELGPWTKAHMPQILAREPGVLTELVARNLRVKATVVGLDERELSTSTDSGRALLNLGHTFGHALETMVGVGSIDPTRAAPLQHGEAVALGLVCAASFAESRRLMAAGFTDEVRSLLKLAGLPVRASGLPDGDRVLDAMMDDKKASGGKLRLIVPAGQGRCSVLTDPPASEVWRAIDAIR